MTTPNMGVKIEGLSELRSKLRRLDKDLPKALTSLHKKVAEPVAAVARRRAPKRSNRLASSVRAGGSQKAAMIRAGTNVAKHRYAGVIHYGWPRRNIEPQPFLTDAMQATQKQTIRTYDKELGRFLDGIWDSNG